MSQLPMDLVRDIYCLMPTKSLARFRAVCKQWNAVWEDKSFLNYYLSRARPQFMIRTYSQTCSIEISLNDDNDHGLSIEVRDITLEYPRELTYTNIGYCDGFVLFGVEKKGFAIWNPWTRQNKWIEDHEFCFYGIGYDNIRPERGYKIFGHSTSYTSTGHFQCDVAIYECKSDAWKFLYDTREEPRGIRQESVVSMNGNLYFIAFHLKTFEPFIQSFDFSKDIFKTICVLPSIEGFSITRALAVFRGDRLSLLMQSTLTNKVEILVTKQKIDLNGDQAVEWINFMTVSIPNFPILQPKYVQPSYFVDNNDDKRLFVCTCDETEHPCIYIVKGDVFKKISIDSVLVNDVWPCFYTSIISYIPSFIPIPCMSRQIKDYKFKFGFIML